MKAIDLNCDMGESFGRYKLGLDEEVIEHITSANIACGWHAGDPLVMDRTVQLAAERGVSVGAHPAYPDLLGFGRRRMDCAPEEITRYIVYQVGALKGFCAVHGVPLVHVKPHGSLYNTAVEDDNLARAIGEAVAAVDGSLICVVLAGPRGEAAARIYRGMGLAVAREAFPDRAYTPQGTLLSRREPGAVVTEPGAVAERALMMATEGRVIAVDGTPVPLEAQTLCVHGDTPTAVDLVRTIRAELEAQGVVVQAPRVGFSMDG
jgi:UPF0271 protein